MLNIRTNKSKEKDLVKSLFRSSEAHSSFSKTITKSILEKAKTHRKVLSSPALAGKTANTLCPVIASLRQWLLAGG